MSRPSAGEGVRCMWMRGGTSKGGYFLAEDLPEDRDGFLLRVMGSPDPRQIDGMGGADPLTSKIAVVKRSERPGVDIDYLFLQVFVDEPIVTDAQNCGNILAGVGPFAIERGLIEAEDGQTEVRIFMENTGQIATAKIATPDRRVTMRGMRASMACQARPRRCRSPLRIRRVRAAEPCCPPAVSLMLSRASNAR